MIECGFFDALESGGVYDRVYEASMFAHYFGLLVKNGVFANPSTNLQVTANTNPNMQVVVNPGSAWINGYYLTIPANSSETLSIGIASPSLPRIDSVVVGLSLASRSITIYVKAGTPAVSPQPVALVRTDDTYELELAQILVPAGSGYVVQDNITDMRQTEQRCGLVTGAISQIDATNLFAQFTAAFNTWFQTIQDQLSGDIAANLQLQINNIISNFTPTGPIVLTSGVHYFASINDLPSDAVVGQLAFVKVQ